MMINKLVIVSSLLILISCSTVKESYNAPLLDTRWRVEYYNGEKINHKKYEKDLFLIFKSVESDLFGFMGCNSIFGKYKIEGNSIAFSKISSQKKLCSENYIESQLLNSLKAIDSFRHNLDTLILFSYGKEEIRFKAVEFTEYKPD